MAQYHDNKKKIMKVELKSSSSPVVTPKYLGVTIHARSLTIRSYPANKTVQLATVR